MSADERPATTTGLEPTSASALRCRACGRALASRAEVFTVEGAAAVGAYANAFGLLREVVTVRACEGLVLEGPPSLEMTWFPGYAWRVARCGGCSSLLGWRYERVEAARTPEAFFGLLTRAIVEG